MTDDESFYTAVAEEIASGNIRHGLWAKAVSKSGGNLDAAKALYIKLRVEQLIGAE